MSARIRTVTFTFTFALVLLATRAGAQTCNLNPVGPDEVAFTVAQSGSDFDVGWKGQYHDFDVPGGARFEACLNNCDGTSDTLCDVQGYAGGQTAAGRLFTPPIPAVFGSTAVCIVTRFHEPFATGTADVATGDVNVTANISADVYVTTTSAVCPRCSAATAGSMGTCQGGASDTQPCTTGESITVQNATGNPYTVSRDCPPSGAPLSTDFTLNITTGTSTLNGTCPGQSSANDCGGACGTTCTGSGQGGISQNCCVSDTTKRCFPDPLVRSGVANAPTPGGSTYPKTSTETLVSTFCAPAAPGLGFLINNAAGLPGPAAFILPGTAVWTLDPSPPPTTTTTTTVAPGSSTTTLPGGCASDSDCDDADPCTEDHCTTATCSNPHLTGAAGADCELGQALATPICEPIDPKLQAAIQTLIGKARTKVQGIASATPKKAKKLKKQADTALKLILTKAKKAAKKGKITTECQAAITALVTELRQQVAGS